VLGRVNSRISAGNVAPDFNAAASAAGCPRLRYLNGLRAQCFPMRASSQRGLDIRRPTPSEKEINLFHLQGPAWKRVPLADSAPRWAGLHRFWQKTSKMSWTQLWVCEEKGIRQARTFEQIRPRWRQIIPLKVGKLSGKYSTNDMKKPLIAILGIGLLSCAVQAGDKPATNQTAAAASSNFKSEKEKLSYAIGLSTGSNIKRNERR
jgi:hypothetical protein